MKNQSLWTPSKFVLSGNQLKSNPNPDAVSVASRLNVDLLASALQTAVTKNARGRLLDLGCGRVPLFGLYRNQVTEIVCVDWENSPHGADHLDYTANLNLPLDMSAGEFDTVILTDVLEHIAKPEFLLAEVRRILRREGTLIGSVPFLYRLHEEPHDHFRYTIHTLSRLAVEAGFEVEVLQAYGQGTDVLFDTLGKLLLEVHWRLGPVLASWTQRAGLWARQSHLGVKINARQQAMPIGYIFVWRHV